MLNPCMLFCETTVLMHVLVLFSETLVPAESSDPHGTWEEDILFLVHL